MSSTKPDGSSLNDPPYKDVRGRYRTESLFYEYFRNTELDTSIYQPRFVLGEFDLVIRDPQHVCYNAYPDHTIPSLRRLYLESADPGESRFAKEVLKSDKHWKVLCNTGFFIPYLEEYRSSLEAQLKSEGIYYMRQIAMSGGKNALQAARWLAEKGYREKELKGRPSKLEIAKRAKLDQDTAKTLQEDAERLGLKL